MVPSSQINLSFVWISSMLLMLPFNNNVLSQIEVERSDCYEERTQYYELPLGWPAVVSCYEHSHLYVLSLEFGEITPDTLIYCEIKLLNEPESIFNDTVRFGDLERSGYDLGELQTSSPREFQIFSKIADASLLLPDCYYHNVSINPYVVENMSCDEVISTDVSDHVPTKAVSQRKQSTAAIHYYTDYETSLIYHALSLTWKHNCSALPSAEVNYLNQVEMHSVEFANAGIYTLSTTYKSMTLFLYKHVFCVKDRIVSVEPVIFCQNKQFVVMRTREVLIRCWANLAYDAPTAIVVGSAFYKDNTNTNPFCSNGFDGTKSTKGRFLGKGNCTRFLDVVDEKCFLHVPTDVELGEREESFYFVNLTLRLQDDEDFGDYVFEFLYYGESWNFNFTITEEIDNSSIIIVVSVAVFVLVVTVMILLWCFRLYLQVFFKRKFGPFKSDEGYDYDAFISYPISSNTSEDEKKILWEMVTKTKDNLNDLGYRRMYDVNENDFGEYREALVYDKIAKSHRVIFFVASEEFFSDDNCQHILQLSFDKAVEARTKVITVIDRKIADAVRRTNDEAKIPLKKSMKDGYVVRWPSSSSTSFRFSLEKAMSVYKKPSKKSGADPHTTLTVL